MTENKSNAVDAAGGQIDLNQWHFEGADDWGDGFSGEEVMDEETAVAGASDSMPEQCSIVPNPTSQVSFDLMSSNEETGMALNASYIEVFDVSTPVQKEEKKSLTRHERQLLAQYYGSEDVEKHVRELYEEAASGNFQTVNEEEEEEEEEDVNNKLLTKFVLRLSPYPRQIIRYQWGGSPLLAEVLPVSSSSEYLRCRHCGGPTVFELQLTPGLFSRLLCSNQSVNDALFHVSIATVLVFSCVNCCWDVDEPLVREERCLVQMETNPNVVPDG